MPNGTGNFRNFQISRKKDNLRRFSTIFETNFQKRSVPFDFVPEFPEILVKWIAPCICYVVTTQAVLDTVHVTVFGQSNVVSAGAMADTFFVAS